MHTSFTCTGFAGFVGFAVASRASRWLRGASRGFAVASRRLRWLWLFNPLDFVATCTPSPSAILWCLWWCLWWRLLQSPLSPSATAYHTRDNLQAEALWVRPFCCLWLLLLLLLSGASRPLGGARVRARSHKQERAAKTPRTREDARARRWAFLLLLFESECIAEQ